MLRKESGGLQAQSIDRESLAYGACAMKARVWQRAGPGRWQLNPS